MPSDHNPAISDSLLATGNLDASLGELADRFTALDLPLPQHLVAAIRARAKQAHGIYFCSNSSNKSYAGHADAQECMPEAQIADFVRRSHQDLFERLNQMPLESSHLAGDEEEAMEDINKSAISKSRNVPSITNVLAASENVVLLANNEHQVPVTQGIAVNERANEAEPLDIDCPSEPDTALQAEDQPLLPNGHHLPVYRHCQPGVVVCCGSASCGFLENIVPEGSFFIISNQAYYCLDCARNL